MTQTFYIQAGDDGEVISGKKWNEVKEALKKGWNKIEITPSSKRSNPQNRFYWGALIPEVLKGLQDAGFEDVKDKDDCHEVIKAIFLKKKVTNGLDEIEVSGSTAKLTKLEFMDLIDRIAKWAAEYLSITISMPGEQVGMTF